VRGQPLGQGWLLCKKKKGGGGRQITLKAHPQWAPLGSLKGGGKGGADKKGPNLNAGRLLKKKTKMGINNY